MSPHRSARAPPRRASNASYVRCCLYVACRDYCTHAYSNPILRPAFSPSSEGCRSVKNGGPENCLAKAGEGALEKRRLGRPPASGPDLLLAYPATVSLVPTGQAPPPQSAPRRREMNEAKNTCDACGVVCGVVWTQAQVAFGAGKSTCELRLELAAPHPSSPPPPFPLPLQESERQSGGEDGGSRA